MGKLKEAKINTLMSIIACCREQMDKFKRQAIYDGGFFAELTVGDNTFRVIVRKNILEVETPDLSREDYMFTETGPIGELYKEIEANYLSPEEMEELGYLHTLMKLFGGKRC